MVVIGLLVDESVNDNYVTRKTYYKAKNIIILMLNKAYNFLNDK